jgi:hypothetical protein
MLEMGRILVSQSAKEKLALGRTCDDCNEHIRGAKYTSLLPTKGLSHAVFEIVFRFRPFSDVGGDFFGFFSLPNGFIGMYLVDVVEKGLSSAMFAALVMGTLRGIHKTGTDTGRVLTAERAPLTATHPWAVLFYLVRCFQPGHAGTRLLRCRNAITAAGFRNGVSTAGEGGLPSELFAGATYARHPYNSARETAFRSRPMVLTNFGTRRESNSIPPNWWRFGDKYGHRSAAESADFVFERGMAFSTAALPTTIMLRWW